jgi:hypothetical protein
MHPRRPPKFTSLFFDETVENSVWMREYGRLVRLPIGHTSPRAVAGVRLPASGNLATTETLGLKITIDLQENLCSTMIAPGPIHFGIPWPATAMPAEHRLEFLLLDASGINLLAWLGRITGLGFLQVWRCAQRLEIING